MENRRRPPAGSAPPRPPNQNNSQRNDGGGGARPYGARNFQPRENRFAPAAGGPERVPNRDERPRGDGGGRFTPRETTRPGGKFQPRDNKFQTRGRFAPKGKNIKPWEREKPPVPIVSELQVTDGRHRGKYLETTASKKVRPTARRVREVMFRILYRRVRAGRFLDLCAGSGMVGIEAISRGAMAATFVERSGKMCTFIKKNLKACNIKGGHGDVCEIEAVPFLKQMLKRKRHWDVVYFDPPYDSNYDEILSYFSRGAAIKPQGVLIVEHHSDMFFPEKFGVMSRWRVLVQGETTLSFYERK